MRVNKFLSVLGLIFVTGALAVHAQPAAVQQFQNTRLDESMPAFSALNPGTNAPELYAGENADVGPQHILRLVPRHKYFNLLFDTQVFYTDNANFAGSRDQIGSMIFVNTLQAIITPPDLTVGDGKISTSVGAASQWYNYINQRMTPLSFDAITLFVGAKYHHGLWVVSLDDSLTRLMNQSDYYWTYQETLPALTIQRFLPLNRALLLTLANQLDYHFTGQPSKPGTFDEINNRFDDTVSVTLSWKITPQLVLQPAYRFTFTNYRYNTLHNADRNDYLNSVGAALVYTCSPNFSIRTYFNYSAKCSNDHYVPAYHELDGGAGMSLNLIF